MPTTEQWRPVPGWPDYEVSDRGRVVSHKRSQPREISAWLDDGGYPKVDLRSNGTRHLDGNKLNNVVTNLAYGTPSENSQDQVAHGVHAQATKTHCHAGHEFNVANTRITPEGHRRCRRCHAINSARSATRRALRAAGVPTGRAA